MSCKRFLYVIGFIFGLFVLVGSVGAQTVSIFPETVNSPVRGQQFAVALRITNGRNVAGYQATVNFDSTALRFVSSVNGGYLPAGGFAVPVIKGASSVTVAAQALSGSSNGNGTLVNLTFEVVSVKASTLQLSLVTLTDPEGRTSLPRRVNGKVASGGGAGSADVNGDGAVNVNDFALVASRLGRRGGVEDVNGDGTVDVGDLALVVKLIGTEPPPPPPSPPSSSLEGMVLIPAGAFQMGSNDPEALTSEQPIHTVYVDAFYIDAHEVTNADFKRFVLANPQWRKNRIPRFLHNGNYLSYWDNSNNYPPGEANHPVVYVSWYAAMAYAKWAGKRLPTEAEWEKAARGGRSGLNYPWGNTIHSTYANYGNNVKDTREVGSYAANSYGLYDMSGNVWEWCLDKYDQDFYFSSPSRNPLSDVDTIVYLSLITGNYINLKSSRVLRGGSWSSPSRYIRVSDRYGSAPISAYPSYGFRCARDVFP